MTNPFSRLCSGFDCAILLVAGVSLAGSAQTPPDQILLKDYKPRSIFKIPETRIEKARYPIIDVHSHDYVRTEAEVDRWVRTMDEVGLENVCRMSRASCSTTKWSIRSSAR